MDVALAQNLVSDDQGTLFFNQTFDPGNGGEAYLLVQSIQGMDGADIRNPTTNRPHKDGAIIHQFKRAARIFTIGGTVLTDSVETRWLVADMIRGITNDMVERDGVYNFTPPPATGLDPRYLTVRLDDPVDVSQMTNGLAGPKDFSITLIAGDWRAYSNEDPVTIASGGSAFIENNGNAEAWDVFVIQTGHADINDFSLINLDTLFEIDYLDNGLPFGLTAGRTGTIDMLNETFFQSDQHNLLGGVLLDTSDFFAIPPGGAWVRWEPASDGGSSTVAVAVRSAWV